MAENRFDYLGLGSSGSICGSLGILPENVACVARLCPADGGSCMSDCLGRNKKGTGVSRAVASNALFGSVFSNGMRLVPAFAVASLSKIF